MLHDGRACTVDFARRHKKKIMYAKYTLALPSLGASLLIRVKEPKWQSETSWEQFKTTAAAVFYEQLDAKLIAEAFQSQMSAARVPSHCTTVESFTLPCSRALVQPRKSRREQAGFPQPAADRVQNVDRDG